MTNSTPLSPAAQAVLDAFKEQVELTWLTKDPEQIGLAAALRAVVNQMVPTDELYARSCCEFTADNIRAALLAIANELEQLGD